MVNGQVLESLLCHEIKSIVIRDEHFSSVTSLPSVSGHTVKPLI